MSLFWSIWVAVLSLGCWLWILYWLVGTLGYRPHIEEDGTTGHEYDGIREYDRPLPKWWLIIFWGTMAWGLVYFALFTSILPDRWFGFTTVKVDGKEVPWTSENELLSDLEENNKTFIGTFNNKILQDEGVANQLANLSKLQAEYAKNTENADLKAQIDKEFVALAPAVAKLSENPQAIKIGQRLFLQNCALCHGSQARGAVGYPNLTDNDWIYGGSPDQILKSIEHGRVGGMPAWKAQIGENGVRATAEYVLSLSSEHGGQANGELNQTLITQGKPIYEANCAVCHGADGKGNTQLGAPNLSDNIWLFGGNREAVQTTIRHGRAGVMPAWDTKLGNERIMLLSAYVYSLADEKAPLVTTTEQPVTATPTASVTTPAPASTPVVSSSEPSVDFTNGRLNFYFATGKADVAPNALEYAKDILEQAKQGKKLGISGYTDSTGNAAANAELSKNRAKAVQQFLIANGVPETQLELIKPKDSVGATGKDQEGRRVEVYVLETSS